MIAVEYLCGSHIRQGRRIPQRARKIVSRDLKNEDEKETKVDNIFPDQINNIFNYSRNFENEFNHC